MSMEPILLLVEMAYTDDGERSLQEVLPQLEAEMRSIPGMLEYRLYQAAESERRYLCYTVWEDREAIQRWVDNTFHRTVLMPAFRKWAVEGAFDYWTLQQDNPRSRKCPSCGRWTREQPGWDATVPATCVHCGAPLSAG